MGRYEREQGSGRGTWPITHSRWGKLNVIGCKDILAQRPVSTRSHRECRRTERVRISHQKPARKLRTRPQRQRAEQSLVSAHMNLDLFYAFTVAFVGATLFLLVDKYARRDILSR